MLNWNPVWPATGIGGSSDYGSAAHANAVGNGAALWNPASILQMQAYFWTQVVDANRNFWSLIAAAMPGLPAVAAVSAAAKPDADDGLTEPSAATHAVEDLESVLESQTRFWNHMLDANRSLWSGVTWTLPESPYAEVAAAVAPPQRSTAVATQHARPAAKKSAPAKKKAQRKH